MTEDQAPIKENQEEPIQVESSTPPDFTEDDYFQSLTEEQQSVFLRLKEVEQALPAGYTVEQAMKDREAHGEIHLLPLSSETYVFRPLTAKEDAQIKSIKGIDQEKYKDAIVMTCVLSPKIDRNNIRELLAGTTITLQDNILIASDFSSMDSVPIKI